MKLWLQAIVLTLACLIVAALILGAMIMVADWSGAPGAILAVAGLAGLAAESWLFHVALCDRWAERHGRDGS